MDSHIGEGSTFHVYLPLKVEHTINSAVQSSTDNLQARDMAMSERHAGTPEEFQYSKRESTYKPVLNSEVLENQSIKVLVVDDNFMVRDMLSSLLSLNGWEVIQADSGTEALALLGQYDFRAVITDYKMPNMSGLELGYAIADRFSNEKDRPVLIIMSGAMAREHAGEVHRVFDVVLAKPVASAEVHAAIMARSVISDAKPASQLADRPATESTSNLS